MENKEFQVIFSKEVSREYKKIYESLVIRFSIKIADRFATQFRNHVDNLKKIS